jgi:hypothetical protein
MLTYALKSWTSVVEGAVRCLFMSLGNIHTVNTRLSRWNYGIPYNVRFDPSKHRYEDKFFCPEEKFAKAKQIEWLIRKGQEIKVSSTPETHNFTQIIPRGPLYNYEMDFMIVHSDEKNAPPYFTPAVKECADITCCISPQLIIAARHRELSEVGSVIVRSWKVIIQLEMQMLAARVKFVMKMSGQEIGNTQVSFRQPVTGFIRSAAPSQMGAANNDDPLAVSDDLNDAENTKAAETAPLRPRKSLRIPFSDDDEVDDVNYVCQISRDNHADPNGTLGETNRSTRIIMSNPGPSAPSQATVAGDNLDYYSALPMSAYPANQQSQQLPAEEPVASRSGWQVDFDALQQRKEQERCRSITPILVAPPKSMANANDGSQIQAGARASTKSDSGGNLLEPRKDASYSTSAGLSVTEILVSESRQNAPEKRAAGTECTSPDASRQSFLRWDLDSHRPRPGSLRSIFSVESRMSLRRELDPHVTISTQRPLSPSISHSEAQGRSRLSWLGLAQ